ncbi:hypothetical protein BN1723_020235, partial [Verticillium longisporum]
RPPHDQHRQGPPAPRLLRLPLRRPEPPAAAAARLGEDHLPRHVDQHVLLAPAGHPRRGRRRPRRRRRRRQARRPAQARARARHPRRAGAHRPLPLPDPHPLQGAQRRQVG